MLNNNFIIGENEIFNKSCYNYDEEQNKTTKLETVMLICAKTVAYSYAWYRTRMVVPSVMAKALFNLMLHSKKCATKILENK